MCIHVADEIAPASLSGESEEEDDNNIDEESDMEQDEDGIMKPADLEQFEVAAASAAAHGNDAGESSSDESLDVYTGSENLSDGEMPGHVEGSDVPAPGSATHVEGSGVPVPGTPHTKLYHLSAEWLHLEACGAHLVRIPPLVGAGVGRHPSQNYWSARFPDNPTRTAAWNEHRPPLKCLIMCLRHLIKLYLNDHNPPDSESWEAQLKDLGNMNPGNAIS